MKFLLKKNKFHRCLDYWKKCSKGVSRKVVTDFQDGVSGKYKILNIRAWHNLRVGRQLRSF